MAYKPRELKFRAWVEPVKKMLFWNDIVGVIEHFKNLPEGASVEYMQYIGFKDKNGQEIYEGDIVQVYTLNEFGSLTPEVVEVFFCENKHGFEGKRPSGKLNHVHYFFAGRGSESQYEVLGNTYQNLDLIK